MISKHYPAFLLLSLLLASCGAGNDKAAGTAVLPAGGAAIPVMADTVQTITAGSALSVSGNIEGNKTVRLGFMVAGKINYIAAQEGQMVSDGQLVAALDPATYSIAKQTADVQVSQVQDEYNRVKILYDRNSAPESDFRKIGFALEQAKNQQRLQAQNLAYTKLYAPIGGVLLKRLAETGEITGVGNPVLVISDINTVKVNAYIPENELHDIRIGQEATVTISALNNTYRGQVTEVGSAADAASRAFTIKIAIANPKWLIRPGMIAEIALPVQQGKPVLVVPAEAIVHDAGGQSYVYVPDRRQQKAFRRTVSTGQLVNNKIEITSGLSAGEAVITGGRQKLSDGASIVITQ